MLAKDLYSCKSSICCYRFIIAEDGSSKISGCLIPALIVLLMMVFLSALVVFLGIRSDADITSPDQVNESHGIHLNGEQNSDTSADKGQDEETADDLTGESEDNSQVTPDIELLEPTMLEWLKERIVDPEVLMLHTEELADMEDPEQFIEQHGLDKNIIVYQVESIDDRIVTVLFGYPFSEWSQRVVFMWTDGQWNFER